MPAPHTLHELVPSPRVLSTAAMAALMTLASGSATLAAQAPAAHTLPSSVAGAAREQTADQQVRHVLSRLAFGPRPGDVERVREMGVDAWIAQQLDPASIDDTPMDSWLTQFPTLTMSGAEFIAKYPPPGQLQRQLLARQRGSGTPAPGETPDLTPNLTPADSAALQQARRASARATGELLVARTGRAVASERQLQEVLVDFWANHFNVFVGKPQSRYYIAEFEREAIRPNVLGSFRDLLGAVAMSPAMLTYLDQAQSVADSGRQTLAPARMAGRMAGRNAGRAAPGRMGTNGAASRRQRAALDRITVGELLDSDRLPAQARQRLLALPPDQLSRVRAMTLPQMQQYLTTLANNAPNRPRGINENYARELMELHTLGVDGGYTQQDVMEVARALTGWTINRGRGNAVRGNAASGNAAGGFVFRPEAHDAEAKIILGEVFPAGGGQEEGERVLDMLATHPSTARFIATKLVQRLVSDVPPADLVDRATQVFLDTEGDLREVTRTIVTSDAFFAADAYRAKVKTPFELVVSASRALGGQPDPTMLTSQLIARMGQPIYGRATPDGYPDSADDWINTGAILNRMNFGLAVGAGRLPGARLRGWTTARELAPKSAEVQVDGLVKVLFGGDVSPETRGILLNGENPLLAKAPAGSDSIFVMDGDPDAVTANDRGGSADMGGGTGITPPTRNAARPATDRPQRGGRRNALGALPELTGFPKLVGLAFGAPEFQRR